MSSQNQKPSKHANVLGRRRRTTAPGWTSPGPRSQLPVRLRSRQELSGRIGVARDCRHPLRELWSGKGLGSAASTRRGLGVGLLAGVVEQPQVLGLPILGRRPRVQSGKSGVHVCSDVTAKGPSPLHGVSVGNCTDHRSLSVPVCPPFCPSRDRASRGRCRHRGCSAIPDSPSTSPPFPVVMVVVAVVFGVLSAAPESVPLTPSGTLTILSTVLGLATTSTFGKLAWESLPTAAEH